MDSLCFEARCLELTSLQFSISLPVGLGAHFGVLLNKPLLCSERGVWQPTLPRAEKSSDIGHYHSPARSALPPGRKAGKRERDNHALALV